MRVAYISMDPGVPVFGQKGCSIHVQEVIRAFRKRGAEVELFTPRLGGKPPADLADIRIHQFPDLSGKDIIAREQAALGLNQELEQALLEAGPFDLIYERYSLWSYAAIAEAEVMNVPSILEVNAPLIEEQAQHRSLYARDTAEAVAKRVFNSASGVICVSEVVAAYVSAMVNGSARVHVIPNGVNLERFSPDLPPKMVTEAHTFTVGFVGTLKPWHGLPVLVSAFYILKQMHTRTRLLVVGDGPERNAFRTTFEHLGLATSVHMTGAVSPEDVPYWLAGMDVAVAPYPKPDGFYFSPLKLFEYMAAGLPVVASDVGQISNIIEDGVNGLLCAPGDDTELASLLERLLLNPDLRGRLGRGARQTVAAKHSWDAVLEQMLEVVGLEGEQVQP